MIVGSERKFDFINLMRHSHDRVVGLEFYYDFEISVELVKMRKSSYVEMKMKLTLS